MCFSFSFPRRRGSFFLLMVDDDLLGSEQSQSVDDKIGSNVDVQGVGEVGREGKMGGFSFPI